MRAWVAELVDARDLKYHLQETPTGQSVMSANENTCPESVEEAVDRLHANISLDDEIRLAAILTEDDLSNFHFSFGQHISGHKDNYRYRSGCI